MHETGFFIWFLLSGLWVRARQKIPSESRILIRETVSFKRKQNKIHVGKGFKAVEILWVFLNNRGFRSVTEMVYFIIFSVIFLKLV